MRIAQHALRRYKQRIGKRTASRKRIINDIKKQLSNGDIVRGHCENPAEYRIVTPKFTAVVNKGIVITIYKNRTS